MASNSNETKPIGLSHVVTYGPVLHYLPRMFLILSTDSVAEVEVVSAVESPSFICPLPERVAPRENDTNVRLECKVGGHPCPKVIWFKDGHQLEDTDNVCGSWDADSRIAFVLIREAVHQAAGKYSCVAYSEFGGHAVSASDVYIRGSDAVDADVKPVAPFGELSIPRFLTRLTEKHVILGADVTLECSVEGVPAPVVSWYKNEEPITGDGKKYVIKNNEDGTQSLNISNIEESDCVIYKCEAVNEYGMVSTRGNVNVVEEHCNLREGVHPTFSVVPHNVNAELGHDVTFTCLAQGHPTPTYKWKRDDAIIESSESANVESNELGTKLTLKNITKGNAGVYFCIAENVVGEIKACASLKIKAAKDGKPAKNSAAKPLNDINEIVDVSGNEITNTEALAELSEEVCEVREIEAAEVSVVKTEKSAGLQEKKDSTGTTVAGFEASSSPLQQAEAEILSAKANDISSTVDQEVTSLSSSETKQEDQNVIDKVKKGPKFIQRPFSQWAFANSPLRIKFEVVKSDDLGVQWFHNNQVVTDDRFKTEVLDS